MIDPEFVIFIDRWHNIMIIGMLLSFAISIVIFIYHKSKVNSIKDYKARWDYLKKHEINFYLYSAYAVALAITLFLNSVEDDRIILSMWWFVIRIFISGAIATLFGYIMFLILKLFYPAKLQKKLNKLRYKPRISEAGNEMKLLSEEEEDVHLDEGMQAEENVFSVDYDVWVDIETDEVKIEKYPGELEALRCNTCTFQTMRLVSEEIIKEATKEEEGELLKYYECAYCKMKRTTQHTISKIIDSLEEYKLPENAIFLGERKVKSIMLEIIDNKGNANEFYFQSLKQAKQFLEEFNYDKLPTE